MTVCYHQVLTGYEEKKVIFVFLGQSVSCGTSCWFQKGNQWKKDMKN